MDFDRRAATYNADTWHVRYAERLVELAGIASGMRVLDAATGTGFAAIAAARAGARVVGVDISAAMLDRARQAVGPHVDLVEADATALDRFADGSFDVVLCSAGLLYLPAAQALREWRRLLKPGGLVGFSTMKTGFPVAARLFRDLALGHGLTLTDPATPLGTSERSGQALQAAGFTPTDVVEETVQFAPEDLSRAWDVHACADDIATLAPDRVRAFRLDYTSRLAELVRTGHGLTAEVIYAFGRRSG